MNSKLRLSLIFFAAVILLQCGEKSKDKAPAKVQGSNHKVQEPRNQLDLLIRANREVKVPRELIQLIEKWYVSERRAQEKLNTLSEAELVGEIERQLMNVSVHISPLTDENLAEDASLNVPTGGGIIDFAEILHGEKGGFNIQMNIENLPENAQIRLFYVSQARMRDLPDSSYGAGCNRFMELTRWFENHRKDHPLELYATERRHLSVLAGAWVFAAIKEKQLWIASLTFTDSRFPGLMCPQ